MRHTVIIKRVGKPPTVLSMELDLEAMQGIVGGWIERVPLEGFMPDAFRNTTIDCYVNEEGKLQPGWLDNVNVLLPPDADSIHTADDALVGNVLFCACDDEGETIGLTPEQVEHVLAAFGWEPDQLNTP